MSMSLLIVATDTCIQTPVIEKIPLIVVLSGMVDVSEANCD